MTELKNLNEPLENVRDFEKKALRSSFHSFRSDFEVKLSDNSEVVRTLTRVTFICFSFMLVELVGGYWANSVAVISDALHLSIDIIGYIIQITSAKLAMRSKSRSPQSPRNL